jgi:hypothetical protein
MKVGPSRDWNTWKVSSKGSIGIHNLSRSKKGMRHVRRKAEKMRLLLADKDLVIGVGARDALLANSGFDNEKKYVYEEDTRG